MRKTKQLIFALFISLALISGCGNAEKETASPTAATTIAEPSSVSESSETTAISETSSTEKTADTQTSADDMRVRVGSLKGPTTMGLLYLMEENESQTSAQNYDFNMYTAADELLAKVISNDVDIALVPANTASILYQRTQGAISVIDINTLGVLYMISSDTSISSIADLKGKTIYLTGKGTTPDYSLQYLLQKNGLSSQDVTLEYKSEATEVVSLLSQTPEAIGLLPQPFVTVACTQNESLQIVLDLTEEWDHVSDGSALVTGVTIVQNRFLEEHPDAVSIFLEEHKNSAALANEDVAKTAELVVNAGIIEKAPIAQKAIPYCNITFLSGEDMKSTLRGYLTILSEQDIQSIGGSLPNDDFYWIAD